MARTQRWKAVKKNQRGDWREMGESKQRPARARTQPFPRPDTRPRSAGCWRSASSKCSPASPFPSYWCQWPVPLPSSYCLRSYEHDLSSKRNRCCCQRENPCVKALQRRLCRHQARAHRPRGHRWSTSTLRTHERNRSGFCIVVSDSEALSVVVSFSLERRRQAGRVWTLNRRARM